MLLASSHSSCTISEQPRSSMALNIRKSVRDEVGAGKCPQCRQQFQKPVALPCGHSLCQVCCDDLLEKCNNGTAGRLMGRRSIYMGLSSANRVKKLKTRANRSLSSIKEEDNASAVRERSTTVYLSPGCPVCLSRPLFRPPTRNYALEQLIEAWELYKMAKGRSSAYKLERDQPSPTPSSTSSSGFDEADEHDVPYHKTPVDFSIRRCNIAVLGATGVGKSRLARAQHLNRLFYGKGGGAEGAEEIHPVSELQAKYMIEILDNNDIDGDLADADGVVLLYACNNRNSFVSAFKLYEEIRLRRPSAELPVILVATKCDLDESRRTVQQEEAESLARHMNCAHMEVSAKKNIGVDEVFTQLVRHIDRKSLPSL